MAAFRDPRAMWLRCRAVIKTRQSHETTRLILVSFSSVRLLVQTSPSFRFCRFASLVSPIMSFYSFLTSYTGQSLINGFDWFNGTDLSHGFVA